MAIDKKNSEKSEKSLSRRRFCQVAGAGVALSLLEPTALLAGPGHIKKKVWLWSDVHIGYKIDGKDGVAWLELAIEETIKNVCNPDYTLVLGDVSHGGKEEELKAYNKLRKDSITKHKMNKWYEIIGNHDYKGVQAGLYQKLVSNDESYCIEDGNLFWMFISAERSWSRGIINEDKQKWMEKHLKANQDKNIIVCSHQTVANTVRLTNPKEKYDMGRILTPIDWVAKLHKKYRIDVWLSGHEHGSKRDKDLIKKVGKTTFINIASVSHVYCTN
jgi:predicted phosphodiesterase